MNMLIPREYDDDNDPLDTPIVPPPDDPGADGDRDESDSDYVRSFNPQERARKLADELRNSAAQKIDSKRYPGGE